jgi:hypothetical protein
MSALDGDVDASLSTPTDQAGGLVWSFLTGQDEKFFAIDKNTGQISVKQKADFEDMMGDGVWTGDETNPTMSLVVSVADQGRPKALSTLKTATITVYIADVNEAEPESELVASDAVQTAGWSEGKDGVYSAKVIEGHAYVVATVKITDSDTGVAGVGALIFNFAGGEGMYELKKLSPDIPVQLEIW